MESVNNEEISNDAVKSPDMNGEENCVIENTPMLNQNKIETSKKENGIHDSGVSSDCAITLSKACKHYGSRRKTTPVLIELDMNVEKGHIYGLLGPSGCGKTTLLKCIVGKLKIDSGTVEVFNDIPGSRTSGVPGRRVGYMPQELALFGEFNLSETLLYFARIYGLSRSKYEERMDFLMKFLDLPSKTRILNKMSGGQQRRASLAVALLHEPELLILDEPTVGVDPLLRTSIWEHLVELSSGSMTGFRTTVVITTHYVEEARQAHRVGMMRFGKLLAEDSPQNLLTRFQKPNLEDVFLELCMRDGSVETTKVREERKKKSPIVLKKKKEKKIDHEKESLKNVEEGKGNIFSTGKEVVIAPASKKNNNNITKYIARKKDTMSVSNVNACMLKTFNRMKHRWGFLIYQFVLPAIQVSLFCLAIGQDPKELPVAIVNHEMNGKPCQQYPSECPIGFDDFMDMPTGPNQFLKNFTCRYLSYVDEKTVKFKYFEDRFDAVKSVEDGKTWGIISMQENFTQSLYQRIFESMLSDDLRKIDEKIFNGSSIKIKMDVTNQHIAFTLQMKFAEAFQNFMIGIVESCNMPKGLASIPLVFDEPVYGNLELTFTDFMAPGIILTIVHSMALAYSAMIIIIERNEGLLDRTWVAGVSPGEFALAHFLVSLVVNFLQVIVTLVFMILVFQVPAEGNIIWIFLLTMLQGICGTTIGLIISAVCETQQDATQIALGIFYPNLILSGIIWPIESMPWALRYISYCLPQTFACEAMRGILLRGWGITYMPVWRGYLVTLIWIIGTYAIFKKMVQRER